MQRRSLFQLKPWFLGLITKIPYLLVIKRYWKPMIGTSMAWIVYGFVTYPFGIFGSTILATLNPSDSLMQTIGYGTVLSCFYLPGCLLGGYLMDKIGGKQTMTLGFVLWSIMGFIIGAFPIPVRGHFLGLVAAVGKTGAAIGTRVFTPIQDSFRDGNKGVQGVFLIGAGFAMTGALITWFLVPDMERELENEDAKFRRYLEENGCGGVFGEDQNDEGVDVSQTSTN
ncbi:hypothetical protein LLEC1_00799 [Akanthomyces lecanii]|uniref:Major facilitator superfamily (MFS) profile domain-containing protein n=1 Tax=Cordyceps confragosa TaxID=2714763 RepID=A0A179I734_CORDF|nr:hypothetical protein LLEC1_00799 [Akanthomyces lecanii]